MLSVLLLFALMFLNYGLNTVSFRMAAKGSYVGLAVTDALIAAFGFWMITEVAHGQNLAAFTGYVLGGASGSIAGLWFTRK